jgi:hypothetical protein
LALEPVAFSGSSIACRTFVGGHLDNIAASIFV